LQSDGSCQSNTNGCETSIDIASGNVCPFTTSSTLLSIQDTTTIDNNNNNNNTLSSTTEINDSTTDHTPTVITTTICILTTNKYTFENRHLLVNLLRLGSTLFWPLSVVVV
jgi:hypothetical protein